MPSLSPTRRPRDDESPQGPWDSGVSLLPLQGSGAKAGLKRHDDELVEDSITCASELLSSIANY